MRISTKTSTALHLLILLEVFKDQKFTSIHLAKSIGSNPVIIRNILAGLKKAGLVEVKRGTGGATLAVPPEKITVWDVYKAVDTVSLQDIIGIHQNPSQKCPVGKKIGVLLQKPYVKVADSIKQSMSEYTLKQLLDDYKEINESEEVL